MNNLSDLELLGQTVLCVNAALQSATIPSSSFSPNKDTTTFNHYRISSFKFNPRGCVWYAALVITNVNNLQVPIKVTCHANDNPTATNDVLYNNNNNNNNKSSNTANKTSYTVTISYYYEPTTTSNSSSFQSNFPTVEFPSSNDNPNVDEELTSLWINHSSEIIKSMEWLRLKLRRCINRSLLGMVGYNVDFLPGVSVVFPEELKKKKSTTRKSLNEEE